MALRLALLLALALLAQSSAHDATTTSYSGPDRFTHGPNVGPEQPTLYSSRTCHHDGVLVGECIEEEEEASMESETNRRGRMLYQRRRFISYGALSRDHVPCNRRGQSYYNCRSGQGRVNPYRRGCSVITRCARNLH
ncbi:Rapid alkalinization factor [Acorus calamus]|uniref:Rapid alkalinization factor n=1 Tax=Acorus calamus TaxID=4465 RepID=A0AAV9FIB2_ACOCL|nr:Rapid alkalinization factor [Acorus calamus]